MNIELDAGRYRYLLENSTRMSEQLVNAKTGAQTGIHRVSIIVDLPGAAPWATQETLSAAIDEAMNEYA